MNIRNKLIAGFSIVTLIGALIGLFALNTINGLGNMTRDLYEGPLIAGQFTAQAQSKFLTLSNSLSLFVVAGRQNSDEVRDHVDELSEAIREDLAIVDERTTDTETHNVVLQTIAVLDQVIYFAEKVLTAPNRISAETGDTFTQLSDEAVESFELLTELVTEQAFNFRENASDIQNNAYQLQSIAVFVSAVIAIITAVVLAKHIGSPIKGMTRSMSMLARGDLQIEIPALNRRDEIGNMASAVQVFKENAAEMDRMREQRQREQQAADKKLQESLHSFADGLEKTMGAAVKSMVIKSENVSSIADRMSQAVEKVSERSAEVADVAEKSRLNVSSAADVASHMTQSISAISARVQQSTEMTENAVRDASNANEKVQSLSEAAAKIGEVVSLITEIADQTNLLALNATIEAARAGDAGKGFAVVASEVKNLANQTARATNEISDHIGAIQNSTEEAATAIGTIGETIEQISSIAATISTSIEEQGASSHQISTCMAEAAADTDGVSVRIADVSKEAQTTGRLSLQVGSSAGEMTAAIQNLQQELVRMIRSTVRETADQQEQTIAA